MQENEFEKQVKKAMEGFTLLPSDPVWNKIEKQIPKQTRRRRIMVFIFFFTGLMVCGYFFYNKWNVKNSYSTIPAAITENKNVTQDKNEIAATSTDTNVTDADHVQANELLNSKQNKTSAGIRIHKQAPAIVSLKGRNELNNALIISDIETGRPVFVEKEKVAVLSRETLSGSIFDESSNAAKDNRDTTKEIINVTKNGNVYANETAVSPGAENLFDTANSKSLADTATIALSQTKKQPVKIQASKKWEWGITALYGRADVVENLLNIGADFEKSYAQDYTNSTGNNESYNFNVSKQVKAKSAFSAGIAFKKQLTYRSSFISGIQYTKLSTQIETGTRKDSAVRFYYNSVSNAPVAALNSFFTPGSYSLHTNTYHLLQVPVIYEHRLNKSKNIIINWNAGLSISRLLGSNALVFDQGNQAFYHNNGLFRKTQAEMLAGLNIRFDLSKKATLNLGPQLNYSLSNLFGSSSYGNQHYINYGLKSTVFFK